MITSMKRSLQSSKTWYRSMLAGNPKMSYGAYDLISTTLISSDTGAIIFSDIPQTYKHLQLRVVSKSRDSAVSASMRIRFNDIATGSYRMHTLKGDGLTVSSSNVALAQQFAFRTAGDNADGFGVSIMDIANYADSVNYKTVRTMTTVPDSTDGREISLNSGLFLITAPVTSILFDALNDFIAGSRFSLYGIKG